MQYYFAPLEGITVYSYRKIWRRMFGGTDKMFMPFISPTQNGRFAAKEVKEMTDELETGTYTVPQLMVNNADNFIWAANELRDMGFREVNLNAGCPSGTVVSKHKGAGMLSSPEELDAILDRIFSSVRGIGISVKTRLGMREEEEFGRILEVFNRYPICELTVHARVRSDFYKEAVHPAAYDRAETAAKMPLCYNGDIFSAEAAHRFERSHPRTEAIMLARGIVANPALLREIRGGKKLSLTELTEFHNLLLEEYCGTLYGDVSVLHKMKELWFYFGRMFSNSADYIKAVNKSQHVTEYSSAVKKLFETAEFIGSRNVSFV